MNEYYSEFISKHPEYDGSEVIKKAFDVAEELHANQKRKSGEPYIIHPVAVAMYIAELGMDENAVASALLHDVVEDTDYSLENVESEFNEDIMRMVDGVTKLTRLKSQSKEEQHAETIRKIILATNTDVRIMIIKLSDRLHNMHTMEYQSADKQIEKATETMQLYVPLARRLGMTRLATELEDLSFKYMNPKEYLEIEAKLGTSKAATDNNIEKIISQISVLLNENGIEAKIDGRIKSIYSIYRKMHEHNKTFGELYDIIALRVIIKGNEALDCYKVLGILHKQWIHQQQRFKDYIGMPKETQYQSLHTTLISPEGFSFEVQIRTEEMHKTAEYGIAAHWKYKTGRDPKSFRFEWLRDIAEWQSELSDSKEFIETLKTDIRREYIYVVTPKGDVKGLIQGSTALDFAYSVHSDIGNRCVGARVNGKLVPLNYELQSSDLVEIITSNDKKAPMRDWVKLAHTAAAKSKMRLFFRRELTSENINAGREILSKAAEDNGCSIEEIMNHELLLPIFERYAITSEDDMLASLAYKALSLAQILPRLVYGAKQNRNRDINHGKQAFIIAKGHEDMEIRISKCCNPIPGDDIIGFIVQGGIIAVHRKDCKTLHHSRDFRNREAVEVEWCISEEVHNRFTVELQLSASDRIGILADVASFLSENRISISSINARMNRDKSTCFMNFKVDVGSLAELKALVHEIEQIEGVQEVYRINS